MPMGNSDMLSQDVTSARLHDVTWFVEQIHCATVNLLQHFNTTGVNVYSWDPTSGLGYIFSSLRSFKSYYSLVVPGVEHTLRTSRRTWRGSIKMKLEGNTCEMLTGCKWLCTQFHKQRFSEQLKDYLLRACAYWHEAEATISLPKNFMNPSINRVLSASLRIFFIYLCSGHAKPKEDLYIQGLWKHVYDALV
jgi:hypothetical protein